MTANDAAGNGTDANDTTTNSLMAADAAEPARCSAKGCRADAVHALQWANPRIHTGGRVKTWLACGAHLETLGEFLRVRGFLRDVGPLTPGAS